jgi:putative acetyltransferase
MLMTTAADILLRPFRREDAPAFRALNEEWIARHFTIEERDTETLSQPEKHILQPGGMIFMALLGPTPVGCCALIPFGAGVFELAKMAVTPEFRGRGLGRQILAYAIEQARALGASSLFLGSSTKLKNAVHLYESCGFRHLRHDEIPPLPYNRADVFMALQL